MKRLTLQSAKDIALKTRKVSAAKDFVDQRLALGRVGFSLAELTAATELSPVAARNQLLRLHGQVLRVSPRQQFFLIVSPEHRGMGAPPPSWWLQDYFNWQVHPYYLALQSAADSYRSSPQALQVTQVMTDAPRRELRLGRIRVRFFVKTHIKQTPAQELPGAPAPLRISTPEATAFDLIRYAAAIGGVGRAAETLARLLPIMRVDRLREVLAAENETRTAQRLGFVLEATGAGRLAATVREWLPGKLRLVPLAGSAGQTDNPRVAEKWRVLNNVGDLLP